MTRYLLIAALLGCLGLAGALWWQSGTIDALRDDNARLARNAAVLEGQVAQARLSATVAAARAKLAQDMTAEASAKIEAIRSMNLGGCADEEIPDDLADILGRRDLRSDD